MANTREAPWTVEIRFDVEATSYQAAIAAAWEQAAAKNGRVTGVFDEYWDEATDDSDE